MKGTRGIVLALVIGMTGSACVIRASGRVRGGALVVYDEPPAAQEERYEARAGYVYVRGRWNWQGNQWVWAPGHWERERVGYMWEEGQWVRRGNSWHWVEGRWVVG